MTAKPRCFVAMAFDQSDTDALYETSIEPILKANGVTPVIINRRQDNRDINHQIIEQLNTCDFAIADLTYARPSVYFEAGYAQRKVGVIYSVRADHLKRNQPDDRRIHFDLWMKPLLKWHAPDDRKFRDSLQKRLRGTVLREWKSRTKENEKEKRDVADFLGMPVEQRFQRLREIAVMGVQKLGYKTWRVVWAPFAGLVASQLAPGDYTCEEVLAQPPRASRVMSWTNVGRTCKVASVWILESLTLKHLRDDFGRAFVYSDYPLHLSNEVLPVVKPNS